MYLPTQFVPKPTPAQREGGEEGVINIKHDGDSGYLDEENNSGNQNTPATGRRKGKGTNKQQSEDVVAGNEAGQKPMMKMEEVQPVQADNLYDLAPGSKPVGELEKSREQKPISRAERRRRIKEQILAAGEGEGFKGYRRRMW
jgi:hypothetical protein